MLYRQIKGPSVEVDCGMHREAGIACFLQIARWLNVVFLHGLARNMTYRPSLPRVRQEDGPVNTLHNAGILV